MKIPTLLDYQRAVQNPSRSFAGDPVLNGGEAVRNAQGMPSVASGGFAATFRIAAPSKVHYAVRCFHKHTYLEHNLLERYRHIDTFVTSHRHLDFLLDVSYRSDGIMVDGSCYPTVRMPWAAGEPLGFWIEDWAEDPDRDPDDLDQVRRGIADAVERLGLHGAAHGDLQHGNILVLPDLSIRLIDYDGMYLERFRTQPELRSFEEGHRNYQHPGRAEHFDATLDVFSAEVIDLSLSALRDHPELWETFGGTGENLLFQADDFVNPSQSDIFEFLSGVPALARRAELLQRACQVNFTDAAAALAGHTVARTAAGTFSLAITDVFAAEEKEELLRRQGETITVFGTVRFATVTVGSGGRDVALINLGNYEEGDFTIIGEPDVATALFGIHGVTTRNQKRVLRKLHGWRVAVTGTLVLYEYRHRGKLFLVPQIELARAGRLKNLTPAQFDAMREKAAQRCEEQAEVDTAVVEQLRAATTSSNAHAETPIMTTPITHRSDAAAQSARQLQRHSRLNELYRGYPSSAPNSDSIPPPHGQHSVPETPPPEPRSNRAPPRPPPPPPPPASRPPSTPQPSSTIRQQPVSALPPPAPRSAGRLYFMIWVLLPLALLAIVALLEH
ncbi:hypothetical protein ACWDOP_33115 [Nocardia sp. NPDC003693]